MESALTPPPSSPPSIPAIVLTTCGAILGAGIKMYSSPDWGLVLIIISIMGLWWVLLPSLAQHFPFSRTKSLWLGWGIILAIGFIGWWWTPPSTDAQQPNPSINQGGTITGGSGSITNNNNSNNTINNFITVVPTPTPQIKLGEIVHPSTKAEDGYQTTVRIHVLSPFPIGNLFLAVHGKNIKGIRISPERTGMFVTGHTGVMEGYAFTNVPNAYGNLQLTITSSEPLSPTNKAQIESRIE